MVVSRRRPVSRLAAVETAAADGIGDDDGLLLRFMTLISGGTLLGRGTHDTLPSLVLFNDEKMKNDRGDDPRGI